MLELWSLQFVCIGFFFQAEDGIRDLTVTGVQTCALPIWRGTTHGSKSCCEGCTACSPNWQWAHRTQGLSCGPSACPPRKPRSEERRVGKECRSRRSPYH